MALPQLIKQRIRHPKCIGIDAAAIRRACNDQIRSPHYRMPRMPGKRLNYKMPFAVFNHIAGGVLEKTAKPGSKHSIR
jgi:hypothetical protein